MSRSQVLKDCALVASAAGILWLLLIWMPNRLASYLDSIR